MQAKLPETRNYLSTTLKPLDKESFRFLLLHPG